MTASRRPAYVIGIDPGPAYTAVIVRRGRDGAVPFDADNYRPALLLEKPSIPMLLSALGNLVEALDNPARRTPIAIAIEDVRAPSPHLGLIAVTGILGTAKLIGAVIGCHPDAVLVPPGGHGSKPAAAYPPELRDPRGRDLLVVGKGKRRHLRSAYDVAGVAGYHAPTRPWGALPTIGVTR